MSSESGHKLRPKSKLLAISIGVVAMMVLALGGLWYYGLTALDSDLAALRAQGMPATVREVNAFYVVPSDVADTTELWVHAIDSVRLANLSVRGNTLPLIGNGPSPIPVPGETWAELEATRTLLGECAAEMQAIRKAAAAGGQVRFPVDFSAGINTLLPYTQEARQVARVLALDAWVSAHEGKGAQVLDDVRGIFALSDAMRGEPTLISQLVRIAIYSVACDAAVRLMPYCSWNDEDLKSLQAAVEPARFREEMARSLCGERATCVSGLQDLPLGPLRQSNAREVLRHYQKAIDGFSGSWPEILSQERKLGAELQVAHGSGLLMRMQMAGVMQLAPATQQASIAGARAETRRRGLLAAIAVERFRLHHGRLPESLAEIESLLPKGTTTESSTLIDPFDGKPLRYKVEDKQFTIYSVGDNGQDDHGDVDYDNQPSGQPKQQPLDIGIAVKRRG